MGWETDLLGQLGVPITDANVSFLDAWNRAEGNVSGQSGLGINNPLNNTNRVPGSVPVNSVGVQLYPSLADGIAITAKTIKPQNQAGWVDYYSAIYDALKTGNPLSNITDAVKVQLGVWGTGSGFLGNAGNITTGTGTGPVEGGSAPPDSNPPSPTVGSTSPAAGTCTRPSSFVFEPYPTGKGTNAGDWLGYYGCVFSYWLSRVGLAIAAGALILVGIWIYALDKNAPGAQGLKAAGKNLPSPTLAGNVKKAERKATEPKGDERDPHPDAIGYRTSVVPEHTVKAHIRTTPIYKSRHAGAFY